MDNKDKQFDLEERTAKFGETVINLCKCLPQSPITKPLISQIVRSSSSVDANYMEANSGSSKRDFRNKIAICKKEIEETKHWLRMLSIAQPDKKDDLRIIWKEAQELTLIFAKIIRTTSENILLEHSLKIKN